MIVSISGVDCSGKGTHIEALVARLNHRGKTPKVIWARGGYTPIFEMLKKVLRKLAFGGLPASGDTNLRRQQFEVKSVKKIWMTIAMFDLMLVWCFLARWYHLTGKIVILDRYLEDTRIDFQMNFPDYDLNKSFFWGLLCKLAPNPEIKIVLLISAEESIARSKKKKEPFPESEERVHKRVCMYFDKTKYTLSGYCFLSASQGINEVFCEILHIFRRQGYFSY